MEILLDSKRILPTIILSGKLCTSDLHTLSLEPTLARLLSVCREYNTFLFAYLYYAIILCNACNGGSDPPCAKLT